MRRWALVVLLGGCEMTAGGSAAPAGVADDHAGPLLSLSDGKRVIHSRDARLQLEADGRLRRGEFALQSHGSDVVLPLRKGAAATNTVSLALNLSARAEHFVLSGVVYDGRGGAHALDLIWQRKSAQTWDFHVMDGFDERGSGTVEFDSAGRLLQSSQASSAPPGGEGVQALTFELEPGRVTHYDAPSYAAEFSADGSAGMRLRSYRIDEQGQVWGDYGNQAVELAAFQVPVTD
jgi:Flagellar basal body protein FlaE